MNERDFRFEESVTQEVMQMRRSMRPDVNPWAGRRLQMQSAQQNPTMKGGELNAQTNLNGRSANG